MSIVNSIRNCIVPVRKEGYPFIGLFLLGTICFGWLWYPLYYVGLIASAWCVYFFRDPERVTPVNDNLVISPADGVICNIDKVHCPPELENSTNSMLCISVFMSIFDCHVNRIPMAGTVVKKLYRPGKFVSADLCKSSQDNERSSLVINTSHGKMVVTQIAGLIARRIICWSETNDDVVAGERFGLIRFGSRVDVYLPENAIPKVAVGQTVIAGETIIAAFDRDNQLNVYRTS